MASTLSDLLSIPMFALQLRPPVVLIVCKLNFLPACCSSTTSHIVFSMPSNSMSGIPNSTWLSPSTTKNPHLATYLYVLIELNKHLVVLCLNYCMFLILPHCFVAIKTYFDDLRNRNLKLLNVIRLPSALKSILYVIWGLLDLMLDSNLINMTDFTLSRLMYFTLTTSKLLSFPSCFTGCILSFWLIS